MESFGQPSRDRSGARPLQDSHTTISHWPFRNRIERSDVEHASGCGIRDVAVADAIRALQAAARGKVEIAGIEARTCGRRQIWSGLPKTDGADGPSAKCEILNPIHVREEFAILSDRHIVHRGEQETIAAGAHDIAAIRRKIEAVGHRGALVRCADSEGKIQDYSKKIASNFIKRQMGRISFLNPPQHC